MSLMKLTPQTTRLRRIARAHGAGEVTTPEYRAARREIIHEYHSQAFADDTQRRVDTKVRPIPVRTDGVPLNANTRPEADTNAREDNPAQRALVLRCVAVLLVFTFCLITIKSWALDIPPRSERDPNPVTSPRLNVTEVRLRASVVDEAVAQDSVQELIDTTLAEIRARHAVADHGFTAAELIEVGRFLNALGVADPDATVSQAAAQDLVALVAEQRQRRGISVLELEELAGRVQQLYRTQGYFLAVVVLPPQNIDQGRAELELLPGVLGDIAVTGGEPELVESAFAELVGSPLRQADIETRFAELRDLSGLKAQLAFQPGEEVGTSQLNVDILEQRRLRSLLRLDNHGLDTTGKKRVGMQVDWLNPRRVGDLLQVRLLSSLDPGDQQYVGVNYRTQVIDDDWQLKAYAGNNRYDLPSGSTLLDLDGDSRLIEFQLAQTRLRSRRIGLRWFAGLGFHSLHWDAAPDQKLWFLQAGLAGHKLWDMPRISTQWQAEAESGRLIRGEFAGQDAHYWRVSGALQAWKPFSLSRLPGEQKLAVRVALQASGSELPATRQMALGGPASNRAFDRSSFLADRGVQLGVEIRTTLPLGEGMVFVDTSYGNGENDRSSVWSQLTSVGLAWNADWLDRFTSRVSWAWPVAADSSTGLNEKGSRIYWTLQYAY